MHEPSPFCIRHPLLYCGLRITAWSNEIRHHVKRSSDLERELALKISVMDKHDAWRADGLDKIFPINGEAPEYLVRFETASTGKLKDLFGLGLSLSDEHGVLVAAPLEIRSKWDQPNTVRVEFLIKKVFLERAMLKIRCGTGASETSYTVALNDYAPQKRTP